MKKIIYAALALVLALSLASCGGDVKVIEKSDEQERTAVSREGATEGYVFRYESVSIAMDAEMEPILAALGEPLSYFEAASCAFDGLDKMYTYDHFELDSYPDSEGGDRVQSVSLMDDLVSTQEGLRIGDSREKVESLYGTDCEVVGSESVYAKGGMKLKIMMENDVVTYITYLSCAADA